MTAPRRRFRFFIAAMLLIVLVFAVAGPSRGLGIVL